jgi:hypothetical protein
MKPGGITRSVFALLRVGCIITLLSFSVSAAHSTSPTNPVSSACYLNPNTGRFWTMDSYAGNNQDPLSLHKYLYAHANPVNLTDPSGKAVWLVTRPLGMFGLRFAAPLAVHVFLAFDDNLVGTIGGGDPLPRWETEVQEGNQNVGPVVSAVQDKWGDYQSDPHLTTFSFHPRSVATDDGEGNQASVLATSSSCVAYNAPEDRGAYSQAGGNAWGYKRRMITADVNEQIKLYRWAIDSRNVNNSGTPDEHPYSGLSYNCGSWTKTIVTRAGLSYPSDFINLGTGLGGPADWTGVPTLITTGARGWKPHYDYGNNMSGMFQWSF